jgi:hypothetical protein
MKSQILFLTILPVVLAASLPADDLRLGIIGTDTSHVVAFAHALNDRSDPNHVTGARVVIAYKGGSPEIEESRTRVDRFAEQLQSNMGVRFVTQIREMCDSVDGILLESVDPRQHLPQMKEAVRCAKPVFIDKPVASSLKDAREIAQVAEKAHVPWFSASSLRFAEGIESLKREPVNGAIVWAPGPFEEHQPLDLSWYGIHGAEMLYTLMGSGCAEVTRKTAENADVVTCRWKDGRLGTMRLDRPYSKYGAVVFRSKNQVDVVPDIKVDYLPLVREIVKFMQTREPPESNADTLEIIAFLDAAQKSKEHGGSPVGM